MKPDQELPVAYIPLHSRRDGRPYIGTTKVRFDVDACVVVTRWGDRWPADDLEVCNTRSQCYRYVRKPRCDTQ